MAARKKSKKNTAKKAGSRKKSTARAKRPAAARSSGESDTALRDLARSFAAKLLR
jgi:hypothetical protein